MRGATGLSRTFSQGFFGREDGCPLCEFVRAFPATRSLNDAKVCPGEGGQLCIINYLLITIPSMHPSNKIQQSESLLIHTGRTVQLIY
jgi:hypothetical protein